MIKMANYYRMVGMLLLIMAVVGGPSAAYPAVWTTAGSAGTVDDADVSPTMLAVFSGPTVTVNNSVDVATLDIRYNVIEVDGLETAGWLRLETLYRDNGASAQVIVKLKRHIFSGASTDTLMTFDSNTEPSSNNFMSVGISACLAGFNFYDYVYYFEVALKKFSSAGNPALSSIRLYRGANCP